MEKCAKFKGASNPAFNLDLHVGVFVVSIISAELMPGALCERVPVRSTTLQRITDAPVKVIVQVSIAPEGNSSNLQCVIDQLRYRTMQSLHHAAQVLTDSQKPQGVIVVAQQRRDPRNVPEFVGPMVESVPKDRFGVFGLKCVESIATFRGDEVDRVVTIPMLETVTPIHKFAGLVRTGSESGHDKIISDVDRPLKWSHRKKVLIDCAVRPL